MLYIRNKFNHMDKGVKTFVTLEMAAQLASTLSAGNRPVHKHKVAELVKAIKTNKFTNKVQFKRLTVSKGVLLDGHHRIAAMLEAGIPLEMEMFEFKDK